VPKIVKGKVDISMIPDEISYIDAHDLRLLNNDSHVTVFPVLVSPNSDSG